MNQALSAFPFVIGCGRSGTTLVRAMLSAHPEMAIPPESYFVPWMARRMDPGARSFDAVAFAERLFASANFKGWGLENTVILRALKEEAPRDLAAALRMLYKIYAHERGKSRYGDKTPSNGRHISLLAVLFPEARFVHVIRDGRDVTLSFLEAAFGPRTVGEAALQWKQRVEDGRRGGAALAPGRYLEIRYEDLVADPTGIAKILAGFCDLAFDDAITRHFEHHADHLSGVAHPGAHVNLARPVTAGLRDWRTQMNRSDEALFRALTGKLLGELGYETEGRRPPAAALARAQGAQLAGRIRGARSRRRAATRS